MAECVDENDFKKHLRDLAHGHHHPEEHDWSSEAGTGKATKRVAAGRKTAAKRVAKKAKPKK